MEAPELVRRYEAAWNAHDAEGCAACFEAEGVREWRILAPPHRPGSPFPRFVGRRALAESIREFMRAVPDLAIEVSSFTQGADGRICLEWRATGTHEGDWGPWQARGEPIDFCGVSLLSVGSEGFAEERVYWDGLLMMGELSLL
jgi:hypothetical protein